MRKSLVATGIIVVAMALLWFSALEFRGLWIPDEGRYADIPREMLASGDWITPRLNGLKYFEKPPLQYWMTALAYRAFGPDEWTARLWTAITGFLGLGAVAFAFSRLYGRAAARNAALVLSGCGAYFVAGQYLTLDMGLTFFLTVALLAFLLAQARPAARPGARTWMLLAWASMALAVLSKGLVGVVLPGLALCAYVLLQRDYSVLQRLHLRAGLVVFVAIAAPWFVLVQSQNPEFFDFFFIHEHFARFALPDHHRPGSWWYFVPILLVGALPWTPVLPAVMLRAWRQLPDDRTGEFRVERFLICWIAVVFLFYSASSSKLPPYILPLFPALSILVARHWVDLPASVRRLPGIGLALLAVVVCAVLPALDTIDRMSAIRDLVASYRPWLCATVVLLLGAGLFAWRRARSGGSAQIAALAFGSMAALQAAMMGMHVFDELQTSEDIIERLAGEGKQFPPDVPFYSVATFDNSVPFYLGRTVTLVHYRGELASGMAAEPQKKIDSIAEFRDRWVRERTAFAVMESTQYDLLAASGMPMRVIERGPRSVVVARN